MLKRAMLIVGLIAMTNIVLDPVMINIMKPSDSGVKGRRLPP